MSDPRRCVYFFCADPARDHVASSVFTSCERLLAPAPTGQTFDGFPVLEARDAHGNVIHFVRTAEVLSHDYLRYLPLLEREYGGFDFAGVVNWHEGQNAPDAVLTVHSTGDVPTGVWGRASPGPMRSLLLAVERHRVAEGLGEWRTVVEATHWSGIAYGGTVEQMRQFDVPLVDIEVGSSPARWSDARAADVIAKSLPHVFDPMPTDVRSLLCVGGMHIDPSFPIAVLGTADSRPIAISHVLPNQWIVSGGYDANDAGRKLDACVASIAGGVHGIVFHDNLKGTYKARLRELGARLGVPLFKHQLLRRPEELPLW